MNSLPEMAFLAQLLDHAALADTLAPLGAQFATVLALTADLAPADAADARRIWREAAHRLLDSTLRTAAWLADEEGAR